MLAEKSTGHQYVAAKPSSVIETKEGKKRRGLTGFLMVVGAAITLTSIVTLLAPVSFYTDVNSVGSISDSGNGSVMLTNLGVTSSEYMTISDYSDSRYGTKLSCSFDDGLHIYCNGDPVEMPRLPPGKHTFTVEDRSSGEKIVRVFSWTQIPS